MSDKQPEVSSSKRDQQIGNGHPVNTNGEAGGSSRPEAGLSASEADQHGTNAKQVMYFSSVSELSEYAQTLNVKRIMLSDLQDQSDLESCYVGGNVISQLDFSSSQSDFTNIFIQDESTSENSSNFKNLLVEIDMDIVRAYKIPPLIKNHKIFVHKANLTDDVVELSQDIGKRIVVSGTEARVWVVHEHAHTDKFFQTTFGKKFWKKRKKYLAQKKAETEKKQTPDVSVPSGSASLVQTETGQGLVQNQTFPDVPDFPDSAFEDNNMHIDKPHSSSSSTTTSSSDSESESDSLADFDMEWNPKRRKTGKTGCKYVYTKLANLRPTEEKVNLFGVVKEFTPVGPTMGSDYSCSLTLVDETDPLVGVKCILFNCKELLPHVRKTGDILCIHRAFVKDYQYTLQINGRRFTSVLRFSGDIHKKIKPETGSHTYTFVHEDRLRVKELRWWALRKKRNDNACKFNLVNPDLRFNLLCQVISVAPLESPQWCMVLTVWDGTMLPLKARREIDREQNSVETGFSATAHGYEEQVFVYDKKCFSCQNVRPGSSVFLYGVHAAVCRESEFQVELCMCKQIPGSLCLQPGEVEVLTSRDYAFKELQQQLEETTASESLVTTSLHTQHPFFTLEEIKNWSLNEGESMKFRCRVKLVGVSTPSLEDMVRLRCTQCDLFEPITRDMDIDENGISNQVCHVCADYGQNLSDSSKPSCMYHFVTVLSDYTGIVNTHISHSAAIHLFNGILPTNFYRHQQARFKVNKVLFSLTGGNPPFNTRVTKQPRPWLDCCIVKVKRSDQELLCLFDTVLTSDT